MTTPDREPEGDVAAMEALGLEVTGQPFWSVMNYKIGCALAAARAHGEASERERLKEAGDGLATVLRGVLTSERPSDPDYDDTSPVILRVRADWRGEIRTALERWLAALRQPEVPRG